MIQLPIIGPGRAGAPARSAAAPQSAVSRSAATKGPAPGGTHGGASSAPLPMSMEEVRARGWTEVDVVFVSGDAYVDHPSFAAALLGRVLEAEGFRVAILAQPDWKSCEPWRRFGRPRLFFAISAGNMDSMINHYTAGKKVRNDDAYSPGGRIGLRPDRATLSYCHRAREAFKGVPVIAGGVEASLRRLTHYDYWSDTVKRSILLDAKADLLAYGMGEAVIVEIARRLTGGESVKDLRDMRGVAYALGASEAPPSGPGVVTLPSFEEVKVDKRRFAEATRQYHLETNPYNARVLVQRHGNEAVVVNPPRLPESQEAIDYYYDLPYTRRPHPSYAEPVPAHQVIKDSITLMRGCFGGCTFCSITMHQGRAIQSRSKGSVLKEVRRLTADPDFKGIVSDLGGPTANMYEMKCMRPEIEAICRRLSCTHPKICPLLGADHGPLIDLLRATRDEKGIRKVLVASGVRMDLARRSPEYMEELTQHHVGGHLKVAPEHTDDTTLALMKKTRQEDFEEFSEQFRKISKAAGKKQYLIPYFIGSHPGSTVESMIDLAVFLKQNGYRPDQVQDFIPAPMDIATCMYHTGLDPMTGKEVFVAKHLRDRRLQRALLQFFKPENYFTVRRILLEHGRRDLIGEGCDALISNVPPQAAVEARREAAAGQSLRWLDRGGVAGARSTPPGIEEDHYHAPARRPPLEVSPDEPQPTDGTNQGGKPGHGRRRSRRTPGRGYRPGRRGG